VQGEGGETGMDVYISDDEQTNDVIRTQPWIVTEGYAEDRYYDFKANPELIPQVLNTFEDWPAWSESEGIRLFYELLKWLNGPDSRLDSNGCGFRAPRMNPQKDGWPGEFIASGGLTFFFRDVALNLSEESAAWAARLRPGGGRVPPLAPGKNIAWLLRLNCEYLQQLNPNFAGGRVSACLFPTLYHELPLEPGDRYGHALGFRWWAWGDTKEETMDNFREVVATMFECLRRVSDEAETVAN
jgi:hypothetical protein